MRALLETEIRNSILLYLWSKGIYAWANNTTGVYNNKKGRYIKLSKYHRTGASDILGIINRNKIGKFLAIEVKKNKYGIVTAGQSDFMRDIKKSGGVAFVAWDLKTVVRKMEKYI